MHGPLRPHRIQTFQSRYLARYQRQLESLRLEADRSGLIVPFNRILSDSVTTSQAQRYTEATCYHFGEQMRTTEEKFSIFTLLYAGIPLLVAGATGWLAVELMFDGSVWYFLLGAF